MDSTLKNIKQKIDSLESVSTNDKTELNALVENLHEELSAIASTDLDKASKVGSVVQTTADKALQGDAQTVQSTIDDFSTSIETLEVTHPKLTDIVNRICMMLADIGI
ncbi:MAG: DUF4404 family protein [Victivallaceae bacterium]|nr:DUF4404 family protein [Victivallaceae bacterium]